MRKIRFIAILLALIVGGYFLGRATATGDVPALSNIHREIPLFPAPPKPDEKITEAPPKPDHEVIIEMPVEGTRPPGPAFTVSGRAKAGSGDVLVRVTDLAGVELFSRMASVSAGAGEPFGRFSVDVTLPSMPAANVSVSVALATPDAETVTRIVLFGESDEVSLKVFFSNSQLDPDVSCETVFPVQRSVSGRTAVYRTALEALLAGPNADEVAGGYATSIPAGVKLKSVAADSEGVVTADFDDRLDRNVAGSCRVSSIRSQIAATLKQFPEVREVIISVNGEVDEALQP